MELVKVKKGDNRPKVYQNIILDFITDKMASNVTAYNDKWHSSVSKQAFDSLYESLVTGEVMSLKDFLELTTRTSKNTTYTTEVEEEMSVVQHVKRLRQDIDNIIQDVRKNTLNSRETSLSITKLQEAVMWLGMELKRLGEENPYPNSKNPNTGNIIDPTADNLKF